MQSFVGFVSSANLVSLTVTAGLQPGVWASIDDFHVSVAAPVPEPQAWAMLAGGLGLLGAAARRRRTAG